MAKYKKITFGFYDFRKSPYALGDCITWIQNVLIKAIINKSDCIKLNIFFDIENPTNKYQKQINKYNSLNTFNNLLPVFLHLENLSNLNIINNERVWYREIFKSIKFNNNSWPTLTDLMTNSFDFSSHNLINYYYKKFETLPKLKPREQFLNQLNYFKEKKIIAVNFRQSNLSEYPNNFRRDSKSENWFAFFKFAEKKYPNVHFILLGDVERYENKFFDFDNTLSLRKYNYHLGHEISLILSGIPFIGTSSGYSAVATFSNSPYQILNFEHKSSKYIGVKVGNDYPFATKNQNLNWNYDTLTNIKKSFIKIVKNVF